MLENNIPNPLEHNYFDNYYIKIKSGNQEKLILRRNKSDAVNAFKYYSKMGLNPEWKGKWIGNDFTDQSISI